jgi:hypothetical protein
MGSRLLLLLLLLLRASRRHTSITLSHDKTARGFLSSASEISKRSFIKRNFFVIFHHTVLLV